MQDTPLRRSVASALPRIEDPHLLTRNDNKTNLQVLVFAAHSVSKVDKNMISFFNKDF